MQKENKNPIIAGLFNMLLPGSAYLYVDNDRSRFIKTLIFGIALIAVMFTLGNAIQNVRDYSLPQGLCPGILLLMVFVPLFMIGQKTANLHNSELNDASRYNSQRQTSQETGDIQRSKLEKMRDEGLISDQEYQRKKDKLSSKQ